jgi:trigger factor
VQVTTERQENCIVKLTIELDERSTNNYLQRAARALSRQYRMPGFRPGKAPYNVVVQRLGIESVQAQVIEQFGDQVFEEGLKESELEPIDQASLDEVTWDPSLALHLTVPVAPEVRLGDYQEIRIPWQAPEVGDTELDEALTRLQRQQAERQASERPAELGDQIVADITAKVKDEVILENTAREMILDAESPYPVPGFAEAVVGMQVDETREFTLAYPEDHYNKDIAGQEGHFEVHVSEIRAEILPELDDEFAMSVGDYEDLEDLKAKLRQSLQEEAETQAESEFEENLWQGLIERAQIDYPEAYVDREVEMMESRFGSQLQRQSIDLDSFFQLTNTTAERWRADMRPQATEQMKRRLILAEVVKTQEIAVDDAEIEAEIEETLEPMGDQADSMRELLESENGRLSIEDGLLRRKAMEYLKSIARVEASDAEGATAETADAEAEVAQESGAEASEPAAEVEPEAQVASETLQEAEAQAEAASETPEDAKVQDAAEDAVAPADSAEVAAEDDEAPGPGDEPEIDPESETESKAEAAETIE